MGNLSPTKKKQKAKNPIIQLAEDIARKSNEPMSPDEIKGKFQLEFPFTVKRVVGGVKHGTCNCGEVDAALKVGAVLTFTRYDAEQGYFYSRCKCPYLNHIQADSKRFVLI